MKTVLISVTSMMSPRTRIPDATKTSPSRIQIHSGGVGRLPTPVRELLSYVVMSLSSLQVAPTLSSVISIASRSGDGRGATSRPNGDADGDSSEGEDATAARAAVQAAVQAVIQAAACQGLELPA
ncbi:hypothetical protein [Bradyrhizobium hereditatis]|uniref:hypothetical protein n=1 Tax=Bradyrhizobium hereditatis TaxID=2821405 RepID=UPI001CE23618|nr:hypothetical protein [Bradyrhizobium hereditatis]